MHRFRYILLYKPFGVLSQFTREGRWRSLRDLGRFPPSVYAAGRLDADSEGLLLLTNDNLLKHRLTDPRYAHPRTYLVQVERVPTEATLARLRNGVVIQGKRTKSARARLLHQEPALPPRPVPIRFRKRVPTAWIELTLHEGRNRQVRRMTAAVGHPALRLVRTAIGPLTLSGLQPAQWRDLSEEEIESLKGKKEGST